MAKNGSLATGICHLFCDPAVNWLRAIGCCSNSWSYLFRKILSCLNGCCYPFEKLFINLNNCLINSKTKAAIQTVVATCICSKKSLSVRTAEGIHWEKMLSRPHGCCNPFTKKFLFISVRRWQHKNLGNNLFQAQHCEDTLVGLSLRAITCSMCYGWVWLISPWCLNCLLLLEFTHKVTELVTGD